MKANSIIFSIFISIIFLSGCGKSDKKDIQGPEMYLGHLDLILDTATIRALASDDFMRSEFDVSKFDTVSLGGKKSYDFFMMGQENFLHISQARGFYENQAGGLNVILQSRKPSMKDSLMDTWKKFTSYALEVNTSPGNGSTLYEILPLVSWTNITTPRILPFMSTYSGDSYNTWNIGDSMRTGLTMKGFMKLIAGPQVDLILFKKIEEVYINATTREKEILRSALLAAGYTEEGDTYKHKTSATLFLKVSDSGPVTRISKIKFKLSRNVPLREKTYSRLRTSLNNDEGWFYFE